MTFDQITIFLKLEQTHSMSLCAEDLHVDKATISKSIKNLEDELNLKLFFRYPKGSYLTPAGERIYNLAFQIISLKDNLMAVTSSQLQQKTLTVYFGNAYTILADNLTKIIIDHLPKCNLVLQSAECMYINSIILYSNPDIIFTSIDENQSSWFRSFYDDYYVYSINKVPLGFLTKSNSAKSLDYISLSDLQQYTLIIMSNINSQDKSNLCSSTLDSYLNENNLFNRTSVIKCNSVDLIMKYLDDANTGLLCDQLSLQYYLNINHSAYTFLNVKPSKFYLSVVLINKSSPYFNLLNNTLFLLQNQYTAFFSDFSLLNSETTYHK